MPGRRPCTAEHSADTIPRFCAGLAERPERWRPRWWRRTNRRTEWRAPRLRPGSFRSEGDGRSGRETTVPRRTAAVRGLRDRARRRPIGRAQAPGPGRLPVARRRARPIVPRVSRGVPRRVKRGTRSTWDRPGMRSRTRPGATRPGTSSRRGQRRRVRRLPENERGVRPARGRRTLHAARAGGRSARADRRGGSARLLAAATVWTVDRATRARAAPGTAAGRRRTIPRTRTPARASPLGHREQSGPRGLPLQEREKARAQTRMAASAPRIVRPEPIERPSAVSDSGPKVRGRSPSDGGRSSAGAGASRVLRGSLIRGSATGASPRRRPGSSSSRAEESKPARSGRGALAR